MMIVPSRYINLTNRCSRRRCLPSTHCPPQKDGTKGKVCPVHLFGLLPFGSGPGEYVDEWVDYHLALGFDTVYMMDNTEDFQLEPWHQERRDERRIRVTHVPRNRIQNHVYGLCADQRERERERERNTRRCRSWMWKDVLY